MLIIFASFLAIVASNGIVKQPNATNSVPACQSFEATCIATTNTSLVFHRDGTVILNLTLPFTTIQDSCAICSV